MRRITKVETGLLTLALLAALLVGCGDDKKQAPPPAKPDQPKATPAPATPSTPAPATMPAQPTTTQTPSNPTTPVQNPPPIVVPNPLPSARAGQWVRWRSLGADKTRRTWKVVSVSPDRQFIDIEETLSEENGHAIGEPREFRQSTAGPRYPTAEAPKISRDVVSTVKGEFDCVLVTRQGKDLNGKAFVNRTWYSSRVPVTGLVKTEAVGEDQSPSGEILEDFGER
ncbi:MAG: hypothetical protein BIFFINMI_02369 [Phycisphaerae bacterium]|nr:hypothetical protein [Phycisphaerae bacterium]